MAGQDEPRGRRSSRTGRGIPRAALSAFVDEPWFAGFFVWRLYADPDDMSQEAEWGFSPRGKLAETVLRDAFAAHWAGDGPRALGSALWRDAAGSVGKF